MKTNRETENATGASGQMSEKDAAANAISMSEEQRRAVSLFTCWWAMVEAERELIEEPIDPETVVLHFMGCGASCMVHAKDLRELCKLLAAMASNPDTKDEPC